LKEISFNRDWIEKCLAQEDSSSFNPRAALA
jgi:hypothetical protein